MELTDEVLAAAARAFARHGYAGATLERIASEAGLSRVTLHRRGLTKDGLLGALAVQATERYQQALWPALTGSGSGRERLETALEALCESAEQNLGVLVALDSQRDRFFHEEGKEALTRTVFTEPLERLLRDGAADGSLKPVDAVEAATVLFNMVGLTYLHLRSGHGWRPERARQSTVRLVLVGVSAA